MQKNIKKSGAVLALALTVFFAGCFLLLVHIGASNRKTQGLSAGFGFRGAPPAPQTASYAADFKAGADIVLDKSEDFFGSFFGASGSPAASPGTAAAARQAAGNETYDEEDPFEKFYKKNYAVEDEGGSGAGGSAWAAAGGGGSAGGVRGPTEEVSARAGPVKELRKAAGQALTAAAAPDTSARPAAPGAAGAVEAAAAAPRLYAALPGHKSPEDASVNLAARPGATAVNGAGNHGKGAGLSGMSGKASPGSLDGASEGLKSGAQSNYNSKMSGGAAAAASASAGGGAAPAASAPKEVSAGGKDGDAGAKAGGAEDKKTSDAAEDAGGESFVDGQAADDSDLLDSVVVERRNGADIKYVSEEEGAGAPESALLKAGALAGTAADKDEAGTDSEFLRTLPKARQKALKKDIHAFLKKVENKYGRMTDIYKTSCATTPDLCKEHEVSGSYLTMTTAKSAKLVLGVKYVKGKWRRYTIDFKAPPAPVKPPAPEEEPEEIP